MPAETMVALSPQHSPSTTSESSSTQLPNFVTRWREHADRALERAKRTLLDGGQAMDVVRYTDVAKTATDTYLVLEGRPTEVVQHIHTVDLEGIGARLTAALARVMQGAKDVPAPIDAAFVPLQLGEAGGPMGRHHDVGTSSGVPSPDRPSLQHDAPRDKPPKAARKYVPRSGNHGPAALDPANPLKKARLRLNRRAARLAKAAAKAAKGSDANT